MSISVDWWMNVLSFSEFEVFRHPRLLEFPATFGDLAETQDYDPLVGN